MCSWHCDLHIMQAEYFHSHDTPQFSSILRFQSFSHRCCWIFKSCRRLRRGHCQLPTFRRIILPSSSRQHEDTTIIWNVCYHNQSSRHNILEDSNILHIQWPVSRSSHSNPGKINPVPNKQKVARLRAALYDVQKGKILYPSGNERILLSLNVQQSLPIIGLLITGVLISP